MLCRIEEIDKLNYIILLDIAIVDNPAFVEKKKEKPPFCGANLHQSLGDFCSTFPVVSAETQR